MNTFAKGQIRTLIYREKTGGVWYGSALEFNLTIDGEDKNTVILELDRAIKQYLQSARELNATSLLNQEPDPQLLQLWESTIANTEAPVESPYSALFAAREELVYA
jgi:hypothetical protein